VKKNSKLKTQIVKQKLKSQNLWDKFFHEIRTRKIEYFLLFIILFFSAFFRLFRLDQLLGFWYDQGRDALVIWDLIHYRKFFLIGPVTGIEGIFLGPFYYYLIAPFYWIGKGSPVTAASFLSLLTVLAIFLIYLLGKQIYNRKVGLMAAFLYGFSYQQVVFARWLANPNPLPLFTLLTIICLYKFLEIHNTKYLILSTFLIGLCLQLEAASAIFFLPSTLIILFWQRKHLKVKWLFLSFLAFFVTLIPQIYFDFRHEGVLRNAFKKFLLEEKSFRLSFLQTVHLRLLTYYDVFVGKLLTSGGGSKLFVLALFSATLFFFSKKLFNQGGKMLAIWLFVPLLGYFFYQGNHGYVWDYYFTGVVPAFFILFSAGICYLFEKNLIGKVLVSFFMILFLSSNLKSTVNYLKTGIGITLGAQKKAIDWIYQKAQDQPFNADFYVPPQIYYSYSYLMKWYGKQKYGREPATKQVSELYTLYEPDGEHPQFLKAWLERQDTIGKIQEEYSWGDITVQKRERMKYEE